MILLLCLLLANAVGSQTGVPFNQRDDEYRLLGLKRAKSAYELAVAEFERNRELFSRDLISQLDLAEAQNAFSDAEVNYQQSLLAVLFEGQYVAVVEALKYRTADDKKHVRLRLENTSGGDAEFKKLVNIDDELFRSLQPNIIHDVYISLLNDENAIISQPYEAKVERLLFGQPADIDFVLLQDVDVVTINLVYGKGSQRAPKIYLQKDESVDKVLVQSQQFSQEVELGGSAAFDLTLELFSGTTNTFKLEVVNLPNQINRYFKDPGSDARLSRFRFNESTNTRSASLQVFLPDRPTSEVTIDEAISFYVLVIPQEKAGDLGNLRERVWSLKDIEALNIGYAKLDLVPRGKGKLLVRARQLYYAIKPGGEVAMNIELVNEGTRRLDNVEIEVDPPLNWAERIEPKIIPSLDISGEARVTLTLAPPAAVAVGRYEARIRTSSLSDDQPVNGEDKTVTIEIKPETNIFGTAVIVSLIVGLVAGIVIYGVRLSRR
jgi:hypothetical protein